MRAVKTIVIVMSVVLVAGFGLLIFGLTQNWHRATEAVPATPAVTGASSNVRGWGQVGLGQPPGSKVQGVTAAGNLVVLHLIVPPAGDERLVVVDPARGAVIGTFVVP